MSFLKELHYSHLCLELKIFQDCMNYCKMNMNMLEELKLTKSGSDHGA